MFGRQMSDAAVPPRKRRRPAVSCVECRRRKIKCDRNVPCTQCTQSKNASCIYKDGYPTSWTPSNHTAKASSIASAPIPQRGSVPLLQEVSRMECENSSKSTSSSPNSIPPLYHDSHSTSTATTLCSPSAGSPEELSDQNVKGLLDRVRKLEETVSPGNLEPASTSFSLSRNHSRFFGQSTRLPAPELRGRVSKTRLFGQSHWMSSFEHFRSISNFRNETNVNPVDACNGCRIVIRTDEIKTLLEKCKVMARAAKAERPTQWSVNLNFKAYVPSRELSDKLVRLYIRTYESTYRILHIPTFEREYAEYWADPRNASTGFLVKMLLVMAIGTVFYQGPDFHTVRSSAMQWVLAAQSWMSAPFEKGQLNLSGLQAHCLILIARQTSGVGGDLVWISVGSLVRMAITMGYHRDPKLFPRMSVLHAELRRRLWATVLEMAISSSFDAGNPPLLSLGDWDTEPPSNINDSEIDETTKECPVSKPSDVYTQTSLQIQLLKSLRTRLEISRLVSEFRFHPSYDDVLRLSSEMLSFGREGLLLAQSSPAGSPKPTDFQRNLLDTPIRRVILALHFPFAMKARTDPRFYFSRKACLDAAVTILTYPSTSSPTNPNPLEGPHDDYTRLKLVGASFFKQALIYAGIVVQLELTARLEDEPLLARSEIERKTREPLKKYMAHLVELSAQRISLGENNIKGHLFLAAVTAQIDAMEHGEDPDPLIAEAAKDSATICYGLLKARIKKPPSSIVAEEEEKEETEQQAVLEGRDHQAKGSNNNAIQTDFGTLEMEQEFALEYLMPDANMNFDIPDSWLFEGWEEHQEW